MEEYGTCNKCGCLTSKHKLEEFKGICEDCYYDEKEENLRGNGHGILKVSGVKSEFQGYFISTQQTKELIKQFEIEKSEENKELDLSFIDRI